jgi:NAD(P)-dependent dehydrogenase (short-subunit alcohol dehydrogenase family)
VDVWINNAGADILTGEGSRRTPLEKLDLLLAVDVRGTVLASWAAAKLMRERGRGGVIVNMSWDHVLLGMAGENPVLYSAAKGAVMSFSKSLAREVAPDIRVNILAPGFIETAFAERGGEPIPPAGDRADATSSMGDTGRRCGGGAVSRLGRCPVHDGTDGDGEWGSRVNDVIPSSEGSSARASRPAGKIPRCVRDDR